jgi:hypothetical protein
MQQRIAAEAKNGKDRSVIEIASALPNRAARRRRN